jgi:hypothetical protein
MCYTWILYNTVQSATYRDRCITHHGDSDIVFVLIWGRCNLKCSRRTVICLPVYKISSLKITSPKTQNSGQFSYPLPNIVSFLFRLEFRFRSHDFSFNLFPVWQPYCWSAIVVHIHTSTINAPKLRKRIKYIFKISFTFRVSLTITQKAYQNK